MPRTFDGDIDECYDWQVVVDASFERVSNMKKERMRRGKGGRVKL
jgi:hypothetical protein